MKLALVMMCGLLLTGTPFLSASPACDQPAAPARCQCGGKMSCCAAQPSSGSPAAPAVPAPLVGQNQMSLLPPFRLAWQMPESFIQTISFSSGPPLAAVDSPLFARNCVRLI